MRDIPGKPTVLLLDATRNSGGWESELTDRCFKAMRRRQVRLSGDGPWRPTRAEDLEGVLSAADDFNCLFLLAHGRGDGTPPSSDGRSYWGRLLLHPELSEKLLALCVFQPHDASLSQEVLQPGAWGRIALAPTAEITARDAIIFFVKFFYELDLHSRSSITSAMAQFAYFKAGRLVKNKVALRR
ncbi:MAG: hypothetical protein EXR60_05715 [Dehalococcoidia bacterium]|nr:hypothetical protein [Dehalococcoidia bacterium]